MIDLCYPDVPVKLAIDDSTDTSGRADGPASAPLSVGALAHRVVMQALAGGDLARAERTARLTYELLPGYETIALDLARVLNAGGQMEAARDVLTSIAYVDRPRLGPVSDRER